MTQAGRGDGDLQRMQPHCIHVEVEPSPVVTILLQPFAVPVGFLKPPMTRAHLTTMAVSMAMTVLVAARNDKRHQDPSHAMRAPKPERTRQCALVRHL